MNEKKQRTPMQLILSIVDYAEKNPVAASAFAIVGSSFLHQGARFLKRVSKIREQRERDTRIYDHSLDRFVFLRRPMSKHEERIYSDLRKDGYSVREAIDKMGLQYDAYRVRR